MCVLVIEGGHRSLGLPKNSSRESGEIVHGCFTKRGDSILSVFSGELLRVNTEQKSFLRLANCIGHVIHARATGSCALSLTLRR